MLRLGNCPRCSMTRPAWTTSTGSPTALLEYGTGKEFIERVRMA